METSKSYNIVIIGIVIGLVAGFLAGSAWVKKDNIVEDYAENETKDIPSKKEDTVKVVDSQGESVSVMSQKSGSKVLVSEVTLSEPGWVAIREMSGGEMSNILGATRLKNIGTRVNVEVELLRPTVSGMDYVAVIYRDNGDGDFDFNFDSLVVTGSVPVSATFKVN